MTAPSARDGAHKLLVARPVGWRARRVEGGGEPLGHGVAGDGGRHGAEGHGAELGGADVVGCEDGDDGEGYWRGLEATWLRAAMLPVVGDCGGFRRRTCLLGGMGGEAWQIGGVESEAGHGLAFCCPSVSPPAAGLYYMGRRRRR